MKFRGINSRAIPKKKEISFNLNAVLSNETGSAAFGFSGEAGIPLRFHFESGLIYDRPDASLLGDYVGSYATSENIYISGGLSGYGTSSVYNYDVNGIPANLSGEGAGANISKFFVNTTGVDFDASLYVASDPVSYNIAFPSFFREGEYYTGYLSNTDNESDIVVYSGFVVAPTGFADGTDFSFYSNTTDIAAGASGELVINPSGGRFNRLYDVEMGLYTNLGLIKHRFLASGEVTDEYSFSLSTVSFDEDFVEEGELVSGGDAVATKTGYYFTNYETYQNQVAYSGADYNTSLVYVGGYTGDLFTGENGDGILSYGSGNDVLYGSGYLEGSGYITSGTEAVSWVSGTDSVSGSLTSGLGITGDTDITGSLYFYATGEGSYSFSMGGTGYSALSGDGGLSGTRVLTTGTIEGIVSGTGIGGLAPYTGSYGEEYGQRLFSGEVTGTAVGPKSLDYPNSGLQDISGHSGLLIDYMTASGTMTGDNGAMVSGLGDYSGILTGYEKSFTGTWDLQTGYLSGSDLITLISYRDEGDLSGVLGYSKEKEATPFPTNSFLAAVVNKNMFDDEQMVVSLNVSGISTGYYEKMITGVK